MDMQTGDNSVSNSDIVIPGPTSEKEIFIEPVGGTLELDEALKESKEEERLLFEHVSSDQDVEASKEMSSIPLFNECCSEFNPEKDIQTCGVNASRGSCSERTTDLIDNAITQIQTFREENLLISFNNEENENIMDREQKESESIEDIERKNIGNAAKNSEPSVLTTDENNAISNDRLTESFEKKDIAAVQQSVKEMETSSVQNSESSATAGAEMEIEQLDQPIFWPYKVSDDFVKQDNLHCLATSVKNEFNGRNLKGCKWAPDGSCLLSNSDDNILRLYNLPQSVYQVEDWNDSKPLEEDTSWTPALKIREGGQIYDYEWFPLMNSSDSVSACFLSTACDGPVHLRDAFTGSLRASYLAYNQYDEVTTAYSVAFDPYGEYIYCGFLQTVRIFNISRPGRECTVRELKHKVLPDLSQKGIISCIAVNPTLNGVYACGSYRRTVGLYLEDGSVLCLLEGHLGGVTHMSFSHDGSKLFTGGRKDSRLICWDMRFMGEEYKIFDRVAETNQRIYFDISRNDRYLISGGSDGSIRLWDLSSPDDKAISIKTSTDCVNGVSLNPFVPILATASGQRHFPEVSEDDDSDNVFSDSASRIKEAKEIKLWKFV